MLSLVVLGCFTISTNAQTRNEPIKVTPTDAQQVKTAAGSNQTVVKAGGNANVAVNMTSPESVPVNPNAPEISFDTDVMDYGTVEYNGDGLREFIFTNTGKEPLIISRAKGSCGCTVPTWPKEPIMPGEKGAIKVKYATNRAGRFTKTVTISSNAKTPSKRLTIKGTVKPKPVEPGSDANTLPVKKVTEGATPIENNQ